MNRKQPDPSSMLIKVTSKRQVTFPAAVLDALGAEPGSHLELQPTRDGYLIRARRIDHSKLAPLQNRIATRNGAFDLKSFRNQPHDPSLRD